MTAHKGTRKILLSVVLILNVLALSLVLISTQKDAQPTKAWYSSSWLYRKTISLSSPFTRTNEEFVISIDTQSLISGGKMQTDCDDIRIINSDDSTALEYWIEGGCNTTNTTIVIKIPEILAKNPNGEKDIYMYYGNPSASSGDLSWSGNFIMMSDSSCPSGWTRNADFDDRIALFTNNNYGPTAHTPATNSSHSHHVSLTTGSASSSISQILASTGTPIVYNVAHTHLVTADTQSTNHLPPYRDILFCNNNSLDIKSGLISGFNSSTLPTGWSHFTDLDDKFLKGSTTYGATGGSDIHTHDVSTMASTAIITDASGRGIETHSSSGFKDKTIQSHNHTISNVTLGYASNIPSYRTLNYAKATSAQPAITDLSLMASAVPPLGWEIDYNFNGKYLRGSVTPGQTGGASTHSHTIAITLSSPTSGTTLFGLGEISGTTTFAKSSHTHSLSSVTSGSHFPPSTAAYLLLRKSTWITIESISGEQLANTPPTAPTTLITETQTNPTSVTDLTPEFTAAFHDPDTEDTGTYYEIEVNTNSSFTGTVMWDSGQTSMGPIANGLATPQISYAGTTLSLDGSTYYWRIRLWDNNGAVSPWSSTASFKMNTAPNAPSNLLTDNLTNPTKLTNTQPTFKALYTDPDENNGDYYELEINTTSDFQAGGLVWNTGKTYTGGYMPNNTNFSIIYMGPTISLDGTTYYWRIRAWDNQGTVSNWSSTAQFTMNSKPFQPADLQAELQTNPAGVTDLTPEFSAIFNDPDTIDGGTEYEIQVNTNSSFTGTVMWSRKIGMSIPNGTRSGLITYAGTPLSLDSTTYYWRIRFWDYANSVSDWSETAQFTMNGIPNTPSALETENQTNPIGVTDLTPEFSALYTDPDNNSAGYYQIVVNTANDFTGTTLWDSTQVLLPAGLLTSGSRLTPVSYAGDALTLDGSTYYWRIKFWDSNGTPSDWSGTNQFTMNTPPSAPLSPFTEGSTNPTQITDLTPEFSAIFVDSNSSDTGNYYQIEVNTANDFTGTVMWDSTKTAIANVINNNRSQDIVYNGTTLSLDGTTYYWRIKFWDNYDTPSSWSSTQTFTMNSTGNTPSNLLLNDLSNPSGLMDTTPVFSAYFSDPDTGDTATDYQIQISTHSDFSSIDVWDSNQTSFGPITNNTQIPNINYSGSYTFNIDGSLYYWRIRFWDQTSTPTPWSAGSTFQMNNVPERPSDLLTESQTDPTGVTDLTPEFSAIFTDLDASDTATYYALEVNTNNTFSGTVMWDTGKTLISPQPSILNGARSFDITYGGNALDLNGTDYYWRIRFWDSNNGGGYWSLPASFTMNTAPDSPSGLLTESLTNPTGITDLTPEFSAIFNDPNGDSATHYQIEVNSNSSFTGTVLWDSNQTLLNTPVGSGDRTEEISYDGTSLQYEGETYHWRIRFWDDNGTQSPWSTGSTFSVNKYPEAYNLKTEGLVNPSGIIDYTPEFTSTYADLNGDMSSAYQIEVNTSSDFTGTTMWDSGKTSMTPINSGDTSPEISYNGISLTSNGMTYYWRMKYWDSNDIESNWSSAWSFTMNNPPASPMLLETEEQTNPTLVLDQTPEFTSVFVDPDVTDTARAYYIEVNTASDFSGTTLWDNFTILETPLSNNSRIDPITYAGTPIPFDGNTYYWRMKYIDNKDIQGPWSAINSFTMADQPNSPISFSGIALSTTSIRWGFLDTSDNELGFKIYDEENNLIKTCVGENINYCDETGLSENTQYTRYVVAYNSEIESSPSNTYSLFTEVSTPVLSYGGNKTTSSIDIQSNVLPNNPEYQFYLCDETSCNTTLQTWSTDNTTTADSLLANTQYYFKAIARNGNNVESPFSSRLDLYTLADIPNLTVNPHSSNTLILSAGNTRNLDQGSSGIFFDCTDVSCDEGINNWLQSNSQIALNLTPNTEYTFSVKARNFDGIETDYSTSVSEYTFATSPSISQLTTLSSSEVSISISRETNPDYTEISILEKTTGKYVNPDTGLLENDPVWKDYNQVTFPLTISGLNSGTTYTFSTFARDENQNLSDESATLSTTTMLQDVTAIAPTVLSSSSISWNIASYTDTITGIKVYDSENNLMKTCLGAAITSCVEDNLAADTQYTRTITIFNDSAQSNNSNDVTTRTFASVPVLPEITEITNQSLHMRIDANGNTSTVKYLVQEKVSGKYYNAQTELLQTEMVSYTYSQLGEMNGFNLYGLIPNTTYTFRLKAINSNGVESAYSNERTVLTLSKQPSIVTVTAVNTTTLNVVVDTYNNPSATQIQLVEVNSGNKYNNTNNNLDSNDNWYPTTTFNGTNGVVINGLNTNTEYSFCVKSKNTNDVITECSTPVKRYTLSNSSSITGRTIGSSSLELTVNKNSNNTGTSYQISEVNTSGYVTADSRLSNTVTNLTDTKVSSNIILTNLPPNTAYRFRVRSLNSDLVSTDWSNEIPLVTWANLPTNPTFNSISGTTAKISFNNNGNPTSTQYAIRDSNSGKYVDYSTGTLTDNIVWGTYSSWGNSNGITVRELESGSEYTFRIKARNSLNVETAFVDTNSANTYSIIINKPEGIFTTLTENSNVDVSNVSGAQTGVQNVRVMDNEYIIADIPIEFSQNRDWSNAILLNSSEESKSVIKINSTHGLKGSFIMYTVANDSNAYRICPNAATLEEVNESCEGGVLFSGNFPLKKSVEGSDVTVSKVSLGGITYWVADGITGTGGMGEVVQEVSAPSAGSVVANITRTFNRTTESVNKAVEGVITSTVNILDNTAIGELSQSDLTTVAATTTVVTVSVGMTSLGGITQLLYTVGQVFINLLTTIGLRRKRYASGYVYNSVTRAPIAQAIVRIYDMNKKLVETAVTDIDGIFWTSIETGDYILSIKHRDFKFPSKLILGKEDYPLTNVYHGEKVHIKKGDINMVIPMDSTKLSSAKSASVVIRSIASVVLPILNTLLYICGIAITIYMYVKFPQSTNLLIGLLYIPATFILVRSIFDIKLRVGKIVYEDNEPAANIEILLKEKDFDRVVAKRVTDEKGRYSFEIKEAGNYTLELINEELTIVKGKTEIKSKKRYSVRNKLVIKRD